MIVSMTGFGQSQAGQNGERFLVTIKSLNHKYFETSFHLPPQLDHLEAWLRSKIQSRIKRGRVSVSLTHLNESPEIVTVNEPLIREYFLRMERLRNKLKVSEPVSLDSLISLPGALSSRRQELKTGDREQLIKKALEVALDKLVVMRQKEGVALRRDLLSRIRRISRHMETIKKVVSGVIERQKKTLLPDELEQFMRSTDVSEEMTRIDFHLQSFLKHADLKEPKGKILDFVGQELQREINTLGAKVQEKHVAYEVVMVKDQIEKIREQVQNVE